MSCNRLEYQPPPSLVGPVENYIFESQPNNCSESKSLQNCMQKWQKLPRNINKNKDNVLMECAHRSTHLSGQLTYFFFFNASLQRRVAISIRYNQKLNRVKLKGVTNKKRKKKTSTLVQDKVRQINGSPGFWILFVRTLKAPCKGKLCHGCQQWEVQCFRPLCLYRTFFHGLTLIQQVDLHPKIISPQSPKQPVSH